MNVSWETIVENDIFLKTLSPKTGQWLILQVLVFFYFCVIFEILHSHIAMGKRINLSFGLILEGYSLRFFAFFFLGQESGQRLGGKM